MNSSSSGPARSRVVRGAVLLRLPISALGDAIEGFARKLRGEDAALVRRRLRRRQADRTTTVLTGLKGGAQKSGQLLSTLEALLPPDPEATWSQALTVMQERGAALPLDAMEPVLRGCFGSRWRDRFLVFDDSGAAAASIGQVYRATWHDGHEVAVKVQYPGIDKAIASDLSMLALALRMAGFVAKGMAMPPLVAELRTRLHDELDYVGEASRQRRFAEAYRGSAEFLVPDVVDVGPGVLVSDWIEGTPLSAVIASGTQDERDHVALLYQRFMLGAPSVCGLLHTDPHPGNFRLMPDGRLGVLDFGSALEMPGGLPDTFGRLITALLGESDAQVLDALREHGLVRAGARIDVRALRDYLKPFTDPARHEVFTYSRDWLREQFGQVNDPRNPDFLVALQLTLPPEHLFTHRVWLGVVGVLAALEATVPVRSELLALMPGFNPVA